MGVGVLGAEAGEDGQASYDVAQAGGFNNEYIIKFWILDFGFWIKNHNKKILDFGLDVISGSGFLRWFLLFWLIC